MKRRKFKSQRQNIENNNSKRPVHTVHFLRDRSSRILFHQGIAKTPPVCVPSLSTVTISTSLIVHALLHPPAPTCATALTYSDSLITRSFLLPCPTHVLIITNIYFQFSTSRFPQTSKLHQKSPPQPPPRTCSPSCCTFLKQQHH